MQKALQATEKMFNTRNFWKIDKRLLPVKVHYFVFMAALSCVLPFRTVFAKQLGISATAIGVIFLAIRVMKTVTNPLFGFLVDYFKRYRLTIIMLMASVAICNVALVFIPALPNSNTSSSDMEAFFKYDCSEGNTAYLRVQTQGEPLSEVDVTCDFKCEGVLSSALSTEDVCSVYFFFKSEVTLRGSACHMTHQLANPSLVVFQNSSPTIMTVKDNGPSISFKDSVPFTDRNCSENNFKLEIYRSGNEMNDTFPKEEKFYLFSASLLKDGSSVDANEVCSCKKWLPCITTNCSDNNDFTVGEKSEDKFLSYQFGALFFIFTVSSVCFAAVCFLVDAVSYEMLEEKKEKYGQQRLWGTVGWGLGSLTGGYLNEIITTGSLDVDYSLSFYLVGVLVVMDFIPVSFFKVEDVKYSSNICKDVFVLLSNVKILANVIVVLCMGVLSGPMWNYQFWIMEEIGASQVLLGLSHTVECLLSEVPCFIISGWVIRKIGYSHCNSLTLVCFGLRYLGFAYMHNPWWALPIGLIHGPTFGIFYAAMTMYGKTEAPPGTEATVQSVLAVAFEGIGVGLGSVLGGIGIDKFGSRATFLYAGISSFVLLAGNLILHFTIWRNKEEPCNKEGLPPAEVISHL